MADFLNAKKQAVYYKIGTHKNDGNRPRLIKAPFDLIDLNGERYVGTVGMGGNLDRDLGNILDGFMDGDREDVWQHRFSDDGWVDNFIVMEPQELGSNNEDNNWKSVHSFGLL